MKDTFKKLGKEVLNTTKNEIASGVDSAKEEMSGQVSATIDNKKSATSGLGERLAKKATGAGDLLRFANIEDTNSIIQNLVCEGEKIIYFLESLEESIAITNRAIIHSKKASLTSSKTLTSRHELKNNVITNVELETAGTVDRDAEIKFLINEEEISWDIDKSQIELIIKLYMSLINISRTQKEHLVRFENLKLSLETASRSIKISSTESKLEDFIAIVEYSETRLDEMIVSDFVNDFVV